MTHHFLKIILRIGSTILLAVILLAGISQTGIAQQPANGVQWDIAIRVPSPEDTTRISDSWFPNLVVDSKGNVHVVWSETMRPNETGMQNIESAYYSMWNGSFWSQYNDIVATSPDIVRTALAIDRFDTLHLLYDFSPPYSLFYKRANASEAFSAGNWSTPILTNEKNRTYMSDIAAMGDDLFVVYDDEGILSDELCPFCADIYFRHSPDLGRTWQPAVSLNPTNTGSSRANIQVDASGRAYVAWDEGWDRLSGNGVPEYGIFMTLPDPEGSWSVPTIVSYPNNTNLQLTVGNNGKGGVMLVWRTASPEFPGIYWMWSTDYGESWSSPQTLPEIISRGLDSLFDVYDMATDSAGHIHLLVAGHVGGAAATREDTPGVYHFEWDGVSWSLPALVYKGDWYPEYPRLVIGQGNQLHATWFVRQHLFNPVTANQIWYAHGVAAAPEVKTEPAALSGTEQAAATTEAAVSGNESTKPDDMAADWRNAPRSNTDLIFTEIDDYLILALSLIPVTILVVAVAIYARRQ